MSHANIQRMIDTELETHDEWWALDGESREIPVQTPRRETAKKVAVAAVAATQDQPKPRSALLTLFDAAEAAAQLGEWEKAGELFITMVETHPEFGPGYVGLASAAFALGEVAAGAVALEHAIKIYPENAGLYAQLGVAHAHTGHLEQAQVAFLRVLDIEPNNIDALVSLAQLCRASRNFTEAVDILDHANRISPDNPFVLGAIGATAFELGDHAGAKATLARLSKVAPEHGETTLLRERIGNG